MSCLHIEKIQTSSITIFTIFENIVKHFKSTNGNYQKHINRNIVNLIKHSEYPLYISLKQITKI